MNSIIYEGMSKKARMKMSRLAKKNAKKNTRKRIRKMKKKKKPTELMKSAEKKAKTILTKKLLAKDIANLSFADKERLSKKLEKKKGVIKKLAKKLLPGIKKAENERIAKLRKTENIRSTIKEILKEEYITNLQKMIEPKRKNRSKSINVKYEGLSHRVGSKRIRTIRFSAVDPNGSGKRWKQVIQIPDLREIIKQKKNQTLDEMIGMAVYAGDVKIGCSCPDFKYAGYQWMADAGDYGVKKQDIPPEIMNPNLKGSTCKHVGAVFSEIDKTIPIIAEDLKKYLMRRRKQRGK